MKASICDFCGSTTLTDNTKAMMYWITIGAAEGYVMKTAKEQALDFEAEEVCMSCTTSIHAMLTQFQKDKSAPVKRSRCNV